jgi:prepilin-type N-terminal cleavage/methylation domain-containing protein
MKQKKAKIKRTGFTLLELLVVIAIIGLLASIILTTVTKTKAKSRDEKRVAEMGQIRKALELYYNVNNRYPSCYDWDYVGGCDLLNFGQQGTAADSSLDNVFMSFLVPGYLSKMPIDPINSISRGQFYAYGSGEYPIGSGDIYQYLLVTILEDSTHPALKSSITYGDPSYAFMYATGVRK